MALADPLDRDAVRAIEFATSRRVRVAVATASAISDALRRAYHFDPALSAVTRLIEAKATDSVIRQQAPTA